MAVLYLQPFSHDGALCGPAERRLVTGDSCRGVRGGIRVGKV